MTTRQGRWSTAAPEGVRVYPSTAEFIAEDPGRASRAFEIEGDLAGWDVADGFRLAENPQVPTSGESEWRISVLPTEIYAVCRRDAAARLYTFTGPVWLIDKIPDPLRGDMADSAMLTMAREVERFRLTDDRDSLLLAVRVIQMCFRMTERLHLRTGGLSGG